MNVGRSLGDWYLPPQTRNLQVHFNLAVVGVHTQALDRRPQIGTVPIFSDDDECDGSDWTRGQTFFLSFFQKTSPGLRDSEGRTCQSLSKRRIRVF